jgi:serine/threonine protein kinase
MGIVYRGWDSLLNRAVAIKLLKPDQSEKANQRFRRECNALAQIQHDHIVPVYSTGSLPNGMNYLVLPLMTGGSLSELLADRLLSTREAATIILSIAKGLAAAHSAGLIHRDVKPANILFDEPGGRAKLTDFGLVRAAQGQVLTQTQTDLICGTPEYMSPEQANQPDRIDARSDLYSLGITLYECLTGVLPYRGRPLDILNQHRLGDPTSPSRLNRNIPRDLEAICLKAMATVPDDRYASATQLADDLQRFLESRPVYAKPVSQWKRARLWCQRNRSLAMSLATIFFVLLSGVIASSTFWLRSEKNAKEARSLNSQLHSRNEELLKNRERLRSSVARFQAKVFSDESLHWQMSRDFRVAMFRDVIEFLDEFSTYDPIKIQSDQSDPIAEDFLNVARAATHVGQSEEAKEAALRLIGRLQPITESSDCRSLTNWLMLNESTRILMNIAASNLSVFTQGQDQNTPKPSGFETLSLEELQQLGRMTAERAIQLAPEDLNAKINLLATRFTCLITQHPDNEKQVEEMERILAELMEIAEPLIEKGDHLTLPSAIKLAAEISWKIFETKPAAVVSWFPAIDRGIVKCREGLRTHDRSILGMEFLRGIHKYHHGRALTADNQHTEANTTFTDAIQTINQVVSLQPQNRIAVMELGRVSEAAAQSLIMVGNYQQAQKILDASLIRVSKTLQTDPTDNELRKRVIEWFCLYGEISCHIEDWDWATRAYATAAGDCKLFSNPSPELFRWLYEKRKHALQELLKIIDKSAMATNRATFEKNLELWPVEYSQWFNSNR